MSCKINSRLLANEKTDSKYNLHNNICSQLEDRV